MSDAKALSLHEKLVKIQSEISVNKGQYNSHGGYKYRSCEDILQALTPFIKELGVTITLNDEMVMIGERYYCKATATISDGDYVEYQALGGLKAMGNRFISTVAYAREELEKKGMGSAQLSGATSSYARKYALSGLLALDDEKDDDATNKHGKENKNTPPWDSNKPMGYQAESYENNKNQSSNNKSNANNPGASSSKPASEAQLKAIYKLYPGGAGLPEAIKSRDPYSLTSAEASELIKSAPKNK